MGEEKKVYSVIGTVTIGTDEYRDLIEAKTEAERKAERERDEWYKVYSEKTKIESEAKKLKEELDQLKKYISDNDEQDKFELWIVRTSRSE